MNWKENFLSATIYSIKFKLIAAVVVVQLFSSYIGQLVNLGISKGRDSLEKIGFGTSFFDGTVGVVITTMISLVISVFIIVFIYDRLVLKRLKKVSEFTKKMGNGDFSTELYIKGNDEISHLGNSLNRASTEIHLLVADIKEISEEIRQSSDELLRATQNSHLSIDAINETSVTLDSSASELMHTTSDAEHSISEIMQTTEQLMKKVENGFLSSKEMEERATQMKLKVMQSLESANETYNEKQDRILNAIEAGKGFCSRSRRSKKVSRTIFRNNYKSRKVG
ncbi:MAG: HAMP domain-containing protein [Velocimicrobium sp.]